MTREKNEKLAHGYTEGSEITTEQRCELELFVENYFGLNPKLPETTVISGADYGQLVNMLAMFRDEQLAAANKRVKELEDYLADRILAPTKAQILESFNNVKGADNPYSALEQVLDELKIK